MDSYNLYGEAEGFFFLILWKYIHSVSIHMNK